MLRSSYSIASLTQSIYHINLMMILLELSAVIEL